jgi:hypothetical protein
MAIANGPSQESAPGGILWQAGTYYHPATGERCNGKIHVVNPDDASRMVCGRAVSTMGGAVLAGQGIEAATCTGCRKRLAAQERNETALAEALAARERDNAEWWRQYNEYLLTPAWRARRARVLHRAGNMCEGCGERPATQVHHLTYERFRHEMLFDLVAICNPCHAAIHSGPAQ